MRSLPVRVENALHAQGPVLRRGREWIAICPVHEDHSPSLRVRLGDHGGVIFICDPCGPGTFSEIIDGLGLTVEDVMPDQERQEQRPQVVATYVYTDGQGNPVHRKHRYEPGWQGARKSFLQEHWTGTEWARGLPREGFRRYLYNYPAIQQAVANQTPVWLCFAPDTEVLTQRGWVPLPDLPEGERVAQYEAGTGAISFAEPLARQVFRHDGEMVSISSRWADTLVTPDHRMLTRWATSKPVTIRADEVGTQRWLPVAGVLDGTANVTPEDARLVAAWQADGTNAPRGHRVGWNVKKDRKKDRIVHLLSAAGLDHRVQEFPATPDWTYITVDRREHWALADSDHKVLPWNLLDWPLAAKIAFLEELGHWDGDFSGKDGIRFFTADRQTAEVVSAVAATAGYGCIVRVDSRPERPRMREQYVLNLNRRDWRCLAEAPARVPYSGSVYCLTVPSTYLVTRRNGKTLIAGNCEGEKDADALIARGYAATTTTNGGKEGWANQWSLALRGATVTIVADADEVGRERARRIHEALIAPGVDATVRVVEAKTGNDTSDHLAAGHQVEDFLVTIPFPKRPVRDMWSLTEYLTRPRVTTPFVIDGLLKRRERLMVIGGEGEGKSTLIRQLAIQTAAGVQPFTGRHVDPKKVLLVDAENEHEDVVASYEHMVGLSIRIGRPVDTENVVIVEAMHKGGMKINTTSGREWLTERVEAHQPDLVCIGPLYKVVAGTLISDDVALGVVDVIDSIRDVCGSAVVVEHHPPLRQSGDQSREIRPFGSSVLGRWPNFCFGLEADASEVGPVYLWTPSRGSRSRGRTWPERIRNGNPAQFEWPWEAEVPGAGPDQDRVARRAARAIA